jgi:three-Cys-motif partner protein
LARSEAQLPSLKLRRADYIGKEQTFAKHLILQGYLREWAFKLLQAFRGRPLYFVDAFSGPWRSEGEAYTDTSFHIALTVLSSVVGDLTARSVPCDVRAYFVEKNPTLHAELQRAVAAFPTIRSTVRQGLFEAHASSIAQDIADGFAFVFVDPTGWSGMPIPTLAPILKGRNREVLVNVLAYAINRHIGDRRPKILESFDNLFGDTGWREELAALRASGKTIEEAVLGLYLQRLKAACHFKHVTSTRVLWPGLDRTYFHLVYGTNSWAGIEVFRKAEERSVDVQEEVRHDAIVARGERTSGTGDLFAGQESQNDIAFREGKAAAMRGLADDIRTWLAEGRPTTRKELRARLMERPLVWKSECAKVLQAEVKAGRIILDGTGDDAWMRPAPL